MSHFRICRRPTAQIDTSGGLYSCGEDVVVTRAKNQRDTDNEGVGISALAGMYIYAAIKNKIGTISLRALRLARADGAAGLSANRY